MNFQDRKPEFPGRVKIVRQDGTIEVCTILPDEGATSGAGYCEGTPLNAAILTQLQSDIVAECIHLILEQMKSK